MNEENFDFNAFNNAFEESFNEKSKEFDKINKSELIISLIGAINSGKSNTINKLIGKNLAEVKPISGWTKEIILYPLKENVFIADTPGLYDDNEEMGRKAIDYIKKNTDIILYFFNAASGLTLHDIESYNNIRDLGKEIITVLNKVDTIELEEVNDVVAQYEKKLEIIPIPISSRTGFGIELLNDKIIDVLEEKGKELLFLKISKFKEKEISKWILAASSTAFGIGAIPIPGSDIVPLTSLQVGLAMKIANVYGIKPTKNDIMTLIGSTITGTIGKQIARFAITSLKAAGWIPGAQLLELAVSAVAATIAASLTYGFGYACNEYYKSNMKIDAEELEEIFKKQYQSFDKSKIEK